MQTNGAVYVGHAEELVCLFHHFLDTLLLRFFQRENIGIVGVNVGNFVSIIGFIPVARFADYCIHGTFLRLSEDGIIRACAFAEVDVVARA